MESCTVEFWCHWRHWRLPLFLESTQLIVDAFPAYLCLLFSHFSVCIKTQHAELNALNDNAPTKQLSDLNQRVQTLRSCSLICSANKIRIFLFNHSEWCAYNCIILLIASRNRRSIQASNMLICFPAIKNILPGLIYDLVCYKVSVILPKW